MNASALEWKTAAKFEPLSMGVIRLSRNSIPESKILKNPSSVPVLTFIRASS